MNVAEVIYVLLYMKVQSCTCNIKGRLNSFEFWILKCLFLHVDFSGESASLCTSQVCAKHPHWWIWWYISPWERKGNTILIILKSNISLFQTWHYFVVWWIPYNPPNKTDCFAWFADFRLSSWKGLRLSNWCRETQGTWKKSSF